MLGGDLCLLAWLMPNVKVSFRFDSREEETDSSRNSDRHGSGA